MEDHNVLFRPPIDSKAGERSRIEQVVLAYMRLSETERSRAVCRMLDRGTLKIGPQMRIEIADESH